MKRNILNLELLNFQYYDDLSSNKLRKSVSTKLIRRETRKKTSPRCFHCFSEFLPESTLAKTVFGVSCRKPLVEMYVFAVCWKHFSGFFAETIFEKKVFYHMNYLLHMLDFLVPLLNQKKKLNVSNDTNRPPCITWVTMYPVLFARGVSSYHPKNYAHKGEFLNSLQSKIKWLFLVDWFSLFFPQFSPHCG